MRWFKLETAKGFEPPRDFRLAVLQTAAFDHSATPSKFGSTTWDRTRDLFLMGDLLSQLSYSAK